ncbi:MAG: hypothetical protein H6627_06815 [Calditrichae bacterium]|nr:hypothetical protein [Calditrichota bacterium]MCB9058260.1 hypothetical protein [Calditrichia bacterium]
MLFHLLKAVFIIVFLMIGWVSLQYYYRKKRKLSLDCDLMQDKRGCLGCSHEGSCSHQH